jgi:long-chain fatty acid transport protein
VGGNYRFSPNWVARVAGTFNQSPDDGYYQISTGNSYILGGSLAYQLTKSIIIDGSLYIFNFNNSDNLSIAICFSRARTERIASSRVRRS